MQNRLLLGFKLVLNPRASVWNDVIKDVKTMLTQHKTLAPISYA